MVRMHHVGGRGTRVGTTMAIRRRATVVSRFPVVAAIMHAIWRVLVVGGRVMIRIVHPLRHSSGPVMHRRPGPGPTIRDCVRMHLAAVPCICRSSIARASMSCHCRRLSLQRHVICRRRRVARGRWPDKRHHRIRQDLGPEFLPTPADLRLPLSEGLLEGLQGRQPQLVVHLPQRFYPTSPDPQSLQLGTLACQQQIRLRLPTGLGAIPTTASLRTMRTSLLARMIAGAHTP